MRKNNKYDLIGLEFKSTKGQKYKIIDYINNNNVKIEFEDGYITTKRLYDVKTGNVKNPYYKCLYNMGYLGEGDANSKFNSYIYWTSMLRICYDENKGSVCDEWLNFQKFNEWFNKNNYSVENDRLELSTFLTNGHNERYYSPETSFLMPSKLLRCLKYKRKKSSDLPVGVSKIFNSNKYSVVISKTIFGKSKSKYLGSFDSIEEASLTYKNAKESFIRNELSEAYKNIIPNSLYEALKKYKID